MAARKTTEDCAPTTSPYKEKASEKTDKMEAVDSSIVVAVKDSEPRRVPTDDLAGSQVEVKEQTESEESCPSKGPSSPSIKASVQENVESTVAVGKATESKTKLSEPSSSSSGADRNLLSPDAPALSCDVTIPPRRTYP